MPSSQNWRGLIYERLKQLNWKAALTDARPFLEQSGEIDMLTIENLGHLLHQID
ncbi:MAG TPA: hypothetical protein VMS73_10465 [Anaerolineaceae bacterium]|nr:hypothetical protein [Anaerolineaceae bacterium]